MSRKQIIFIGLGGFVLGVIVAAVVANIVMTRTISQLSVAGQLSGAQSQSPGNATSTNCAVTTGQAVISGDSMDGILSDGQKVTVLENYYACHDVARGDIVVYNYPGQPIVKKVMGMSGDMLGLQASGAGWNILINGQPLKNAQGEKYLIGQSGDSMLSLYVHDYKGTIPAGSYLILGNLAGGSNDSTAFGLVGGTDFLGKVQM